MHRFLRARAGNSPSWDRANRFYEWARPPRQLKTTTLGKIVIVFSIVIGVAATNTGNNLLYLVLGGLFGTIAASGVLSERVIKKLSVRLVMPRYGIAGSASGITVILQSEKDTDSFLLWVELFDHDERTLGRTFVREIPGYGQRAVSVSIRPESRGAFEIAGVRVRTSFPFQMYEKSRKFESANAVLWTAPAPAQVDAAALGAKGSERGDRRARGTDGDEFRGLREHMEQDPPSRIHWRRTAATGELLTKQFSSRASPEVLIQLRAGATDGAFELALADVAGYLRAARNADIPVRLECGHATTVVSGSGAGLADAMLALAAVKRSDVPAGVEPVLIRVQG